MIVTIPGSLGNIHGELEAPKNIPSPPLVILSHGFGGNHVGNQDYARYFNLHGLATYNFDFCGGGLESKSDGSMVDMSVLTEAEDLGNVIDRFKNDNRFSKILLWGASQGGFVSAYVAGKRNDVDGLVLEYPAFIIPDDARNRMQPDGSFLEKDCVLEIEIGRRYSEDAVSVDIYEVISNYTGDVLILHGNRDSIVPLSYSMRALDVFHSAKLFVMTGADHGFLGEMRIDAMRRKTEFLRGTT